jgi:hypothetical protein
LNIEHIHLPDEYATIYPWIDYCVSSIIMNQPETFNNCLHMASQVGNVNILVYLIKVLEIHESKLADSLPIIIESANKDKMTPFAIAVK